MIERFLATKPEYWLVTTFYFSKTWLALNNVTLVTRNLWRKLRDMSASTTETGKISNKEANCWKEIGEKFNFLVAEAAVLKTVLKLTMTSLKD